MKGRPKEFGWVKCEAEEVGEEGIEGGGRAEKVEREKEKQVGE